ncbi:YmfQ family protein [Sphingomonas sp. TX0522]|uniref:YmfQ family protein n=1 Tax=Sphingomonas sp. TX0522 TaxID=2479205 RepID=UPI0018DF797B|nr:putative phage tail protein [Sphingomonas sp. TX0522]MBI0530103.1 DUF2313 domain-containing protein [Sphingomonas sp. TX0522]
MDAAAYRDQLAQLLPLGRAWTRAADSVMGRLLAALADELARVDGRAADLLDEADPRTTLELLADWERVAGLPDNCTGTSGTVGERRIALLSKLTQIGGQSIPAMTMLAARLGYVVEIGEFAPAAVGFDAGDELTGDAWAHAWLVEVLIDEESYLANYAEFVAGSAAGDPLRSVGALDLECVLNRVKPAHTHISFVYSVEPDPAFWFDFTAEG